MKGGILNVVQVQKARGLFFYGVVYLQDMVTVVRKRLQRFMLFSEVSSSSTVGKKESLEQ